MSWLLPREPGNAENGSDVEMRQVKEAQQAGAIRDRSLAQAEESLRGLKVDSYL
jgi:hypothetical protein